MLTVRVIPCLDVKDGRVVKGIRFQGLRDAGDPAELASRYEADGADEIVVLDVSATPEGRDAKYDTIRRIRRGLSIPLTVGGGVSDEAGASRLLDAGADKVAINTRAVLEPSLIERIATKLGSQCCVVAIDAARSGGEPSASSDAIAEAASAEPTPRYEVVIRSGKERTGTDVRDWAARSAELGAGEILLTSWDRDGTQAGYETTLTRQVADAARVPIIASGGAKTAEHMAEALRAGANAVLAASIFHDANTTIGRIKETLHELGFEVRHGLERNG